LASTLHKLSRPGIHERTNERSSSRPNGAAKTHQRRSRRGYIGVGCGAVVAAAAAATAAAAVAAATAVVIVAVEEGGEGGEGGGNERGMARDGEQHGCLGVGAVD